jgi:hypothetical protein
VTAAGAFLFYLVFLPAEVYWLDAPEFVAAAHDLGQVHPPGHPVVAVLLKAFLLIPIGSIPFRANLFSAVFGAVSAGLVCAIGRTVLGPVPAPGGQPRKDPGEVLVGWASFGAAAAFATGYSAVIQGLSVEVYTFNAALVLGALLLALRRPREAGSGVAIGALVGLGLANHHFLTLLAVPAIVAAFLWPVQPREPGRPCWRPLATGLVTGALITLGSYGILWARACAGAWPAWADTSTLDGLVWVASARVFAGSLGGFDDPVSGILGNVGKASLLLADDLSVAGIVAAAGGVWIVGRTAGVRTAVVLALFLGLGLASKISMGLLDPGNPDDHGYFLPAIAILSVLVSSVAAAVLGLGPARRGAARWLCVTLGMILLAGQFAVAASAGISAATERTRFEDGTRLSRELWESVPTRSVLFLSYYPMYFRALYDQQVEGVRPDVTLVQASLYSKARGGGDYARALMRRDPDLGPVASEFVERGVLDFGRIRGLARHRPVRMEAADDLIVPPAAVRFEGWTFAVDSTPGAADASRHVATVVDAAEGWPSVEPETRRVLILHLAATAEWLRRQDRRRDARTLLEAALVLNPLDLEVRRRLDEVR